MAELEIGSSSSHCLACNRGAFPWENGHYKVAGYGPEKGSPGCGEEWTAVRINYVYGRMKETIEHLKANVYPNLAHLTWHYFDPQNMETKND